MHAKFPMLGHVSRVNVKLGSMPVVKITDPQQVSQIVAFVDSHRTGWTKPWQGIPVPAVTAECFDGTMFKGSFGAGNGFFETQREGGFFSQNASPSELHRFLDLTGVAHVLE